MNALHQWSKKWLLSLNSNKCHVVSYPSIHHIFNEKLTKRNSVQYEGKISCFFNSCTLIHVFEQLSEVSGVRLNSQRQRTVMTARSQFIRVVSSAWQKVVKNNACWGSARMFSASSASCDAVGSGHDTDWAEPRVVRVQPSIQPLSDEVAKPHQAGEELGEHHRLVNRLQRITVHSVTTHDF